MEITDELAAKSFLAERGIQRDPVDHRTLVDIANTVIETGSPAMRCQVEIIAVSEQEV